MTDVALGSRERVLTVAEPLFLHQGYGGVSLRDLGKELGIKPASLYYHFPGGKDELFVEVMQRMMERTRQGLQQAIGSAPADVRSQLRAAAGYLASQPPIDMTRMMRSDLVSVAEDHSRRLQADMYRCLLRPIERLLLDGMERGELARTIDPMLVAGSFLVVVNSMHDAQAYSHVPGETMAVNVVDVLLDGLRPRES